MSEVQPILKVTDLKTYFDVTKGLFAPKQIVKAVDGISFEVYPNETFGLVGESGCGKSTLGRTIVKLYEPAGGTIEFDGKDISKIKVKKINGKKLSAKKNYKIRVKAYKTINGKKTYIAKSIVGHFVTKKNKKYTNPKKIKLTKSTFTLKVGKTAKIKGKVVPVNKKKKFLSKKHARTLRFSVADSSIVTVTKKGKIKAVGTGTTSVYVYAKNGLTKEVKVTVK